MKVKTRKRKRKTEKKKRPQRGTPETAQKNIILKSNVKRNRAAINAKK